MPFWGLLALANFGSPLCLSHHRHGVSSAHRLPHPRSYFLQPWFPLGVGDWVAWCSLFLLLFNLLPRLTVALSTILVGQQWLSPLSGHSSSNSTSSRLSFDAACSRQRACPQGLVGFLCSLLSFGTPCSGSASSLHRSASALVCYSGVPHCVSHSLLFKL